MVSRIQGITAEIGCDTTKLSKALEGVNKSIKGTERCVVKEYCMLEDWF